ncbi:aflatoxin B1-aldehyde reductase GliO-like protein [Aspergillus bombycis]|uniref:Aflatoxin B1-aldehyde reductase GliO-like protein n=1 Tax=Aspergillus bombycis TaxID=109264 RepID=A0A1F8A8P1_9EURO|nr:aflatoxin B1-aldehyde reductase GliO-like protein [Aspergillus bombycis]OGM48067.1 aflatoxin B1-aldehyde reductase GliO-like protein [Aspergillus bombycis]
MASESTSHPRVILGLMTFGPDVNKGARITSLDEFGQCLDYLKSQGYNEVDTARMYLGEKQEEFTAAVGWKERGLSLATKVYPTQPGVHKPASLRRKFHESLSALQTDQVDIFYLHAADRSVPFAETLEAANELYREGKFKRLGLSNYTAFEVAEIVILCTERGWVRPTIYQAMYNAITRNIETELIPCCRRYGLEIVVYNPLAGGILSGKYQAGAAVPEDGRFSDKNTTGALYRQRYLNDSVLNALDIIKPMAEKHSLTLSDVAFRWLCHHSQLRLDGDGKDGILIGVSSFGQLQQNLKALQQGPLPDELVDALDEAWMCVKPVSANYWHLDLQYTYDTEAALFGR